MRSSPLPKASIVVAVLAAAGLFGCASTDRVAGTGADASQDVAPVDPETFVGPPAKGPDAAMDEELAGSGSSSSDDEEMGTGGDLALDDESDEKVPELTPEDFEEGFCVDDIYAKYLVKRYAEERGHARPPAFQDGADSDGGSRHRHRKRHHRNRPDYYEKHLAEFRALGYAHDVMNGRTAPYFGAIPIVVNDKVDFWVQYFKTSGREMFMKWLVRGESIKRVVQPVLKDGGLPEEFFYLAMIESGLSNSASSRTRATGTWQFMSGTAQLYGLKINHWVDERRDPVKSTIAAANYLKDLYDDLGDWYLAMAAYNAGPGKVRKAIRLSKSADFWHLSDTRNLAKETKQYVPKVLAAILLAAQPKSHGFDVQPDAADDIPLTEVVVKRPVRLNELAQQLGIAPKTLAHWNPELIRGITPPSKNGYSLRLGAAQAEVFPQIEDKLSVLDVKDVAMHRVRKGETLGRIAKHYGVRIKEIQALNPDLEPGRLKPGRQIAIPVPGVVTTSRPPEAHDVL